MPLNSETLKLLSNSPSISSSNPPSFSPNRVGIRNSTDYSPFGVELDGRTVNLEGYRYGFQNQEKDDEFKGEGSSYDFGARMYDARVGRWLSIDPLAVKYPYLSPYNFVANMPTIAVDPDGKEIIVVVASDEHDNSFKFINAAIRELRKMSNRKSASTQNRTLVLANVNNFYSEKAIAKIKSRGEKYGFSVMVVNSEQDLADYINGTQENVHGECRDIDKITAMKFYAHGTPGNIHMNYGFNSDWAINKKFIGKINENEPSTYSDDVFSKGACVTSYACRTGAGNDLSRGMDNPIGDLENNVGYQRTLSRTDKSLAQFMANEWDVRVYALLERSYYQSLFSTGYGFGNQFKNIKGNLDAEPEIIDGKTMTLGGSVKDVEVCDGMSNVSRKWWTFEKGKKALPN